MYQKRIEEVYTVRDMLTQMIDEKAYLNYEGMSVQDLSAADGVLKVMLDWLLRKHRAYKITGGKA